MSKICPHCKEVLTDTARLSKHFLDNSGSHPDYNKWVEDQK